MALKVRTYGILRPLPVFASLFPAPQSTRSTRSRHTRGIPYLKCRTTLGQKSLVLRAALFFNALPNDLKSSLFTSQFDRGFKRLMDDPVWFERYRAILFDNVGNVYSAFQNYRRLGFLKYFKFGWNFLRIVFGILLRIAPQLLSYSF